MANRVSGIISFQVDGESYKAKGNFTYNYGYAMRTTIKGADSIHGFRDEISVPFVEGAITDDGTVDIKKLSEVTDSTVTLKLGNSKVFVLRNAWSVNPDGIQGSTEESEIAVRFEGKSAEDVAV